MDSEDNDPEMEDDVEDNSSSDLFEDSDDEDIEIDKETTDEIARLKDVLLTNPYSYDDYIKLIGIFRKVGELDELRKVREDFANRFPLSPSLWLEWISDEQKLATTAEEKQSVIDLFERAVQDYVSVDLWLEYCQFMMSIMETESGTEGVRAVVNKAISFVGLDSSNGSLIWSFWIEFEKALLQLATNDDARKVQIEKIFEVYRRMLRVPLLTIEETFQEYLNFVEEVKELVTFSDTDRVKSEFEHTLKKLELLTPFETSLLQSNESTRREVYIKYIEFAETKLDPATVQSVYERAVTHHCLDADLWIRYIDYLESKLKVLEVSRRVLHRATRNCPWSCNLWIKYLKCLERYAVSRNEVIGTFETALKAGLPSGSDFLQLWTAYLDYTRRVTNFSMEKDVESIRKTFAMATDHLATMPDADPNFTILQYSAKVEAACCKAIGIAREIWNNMMEQPILSAQAQLWVEYFHLERLHGDINHAKEVLSRGLKLCWDWPETIGQLLIKLEREEGTSLHDYEEALKKYEKTMKRVSKRREADQEKTNIVPAKQKKNISEAQQSKKRKVEPTNDDTFKVPKIPDKKKGKIEEIVVKQEQVPHYVKPKDAREKGNDLHTVFVSNLDFSVDDDKLKEVFSQFGTVVDVRLVRNFKGLSKGFGYIEFEDMAGARNALKNDRTKIGERPCFISELNKKVGFKFKSEAEKNKLFVSSLDPQITSDQLKEVFSKFGDLKDVRIVTYRNGHSKGCAYVEYSDEIGAANGLKADGLLIGDKNVKVEISNPKRAGMKPEAVKTLGSSTVFGSSGRKRIDAPMIPVSVRRQQMKNGVPGGPPNSDAPGSSMSNNQFRQLLN